MIFNLHPNLAKKIFIADFPLCRLLLEDEKHYLWFFLVPRRENISRIMDLTDSDQLQLIKELDYLQKMMWKEFDLNQLNVAAIGNKTPQLHVHVIGRNVNDPAWPNTVWDHPVRSPYDEREKDSMIQRLQSLISPTWTATN
jgi:diadenosine tetraphosphate (Ap4A) HIT family hydrolase